MISKITIFKNASILAGGGAVTFFITFLSAPIMSRLFPPESYGQFAIINSIVSPISTLVFFGYQNTILIPKSYSSFLRIVGLCFFLLFLSVTITTLLFFLLKELQIGSQVILHNWGIIPLIVLLNGLVQILNKIVIRRNQFKINSFARLSSSVSSKIGGIGYGVWISSNVLGLLVAEIINKGTNILLLLCKHTRKLLLISISLLNFNKSRELIQAYKAYPLFNLPSDLVQMLILQMPIYFLSAFYLNEFVGAFTMANSLLNVPLMILGQAMATAVFKGSIDIFNEDESLLPIHIIRAIRQLFYLTIIPFGVLYGFGDILLTYFLGSEWEDSAKVVILLAPLGLVSIIHYSLWSMYLVMRKEHYRLIITIITANILIIYFSMFQGIEALTYIEYYIRIMCLIQGATIVHILFLVGVKRISILFHVLGFILIAFLTFNLFGVFGSLFKSL